MFERANAPTFERCPATPRLEEALARVTSIRARRVLDRAATRRLLEAASESEWADLKVVDTITEVEPFHLRLLLPNSKRRELFARRPGDDWAMAVDPNLVELVTLSCQTE
jgi:hypothetical protein